METHPRLRLGASLLLFAGVCLQAACTQAHPDTESQALPATSATSTQAAVPDPGASTGTVTSGAPIPPGVYATKGGWGRLAIEASPAGGGFVLETENAGDGCHFEGRLHGNRATVYDSDTPSQCVLDLTLEQAVVSIASSTDACDAYCGRNGSYQGDYTRLAPVCEPKAVQQARDRFKSLYAGKAYTEAEKVIAPVYRQCLANLSMLDEGGVRNDYALTRHKLNDDAGCLAALEKYRVDVARSDDEIIEGMAPAVAEDYLFVIHAARTNHALCSR